MIGYPWQSIADREGSPQWTVLDRLVRDAGSVHSGPSKGVAFRLIPLSWVVHFRRQPVQKRRLLTGQDGLLFTGVSESAEIGLSQTVDNKICHILNSVS